MTVLEVGVGLIGSAMIIGNVIAMLRTNSVTMERLKEVKSTSILIANCH